MFISTKTKYQKLKIKVTSQNAKFFYFCSVFLHFAF